MSESRIDRVVTAGTFSIDGEDFDVENNIWLVGDDTECIVIDAAHDHEPIIAAVDGRHVRAIVCTHGHNDHINAAVALSDALDSPVWLHPDDAMLWHEIHPETSFDASLRAGQVIKVGGRSLRVLHTPGHSPGGVCLHDVAGDVVFSGDTLFQGGPGATGRSYSDFDVIIRSLQDQLLHLPAHTVVHAGHGDDTTIGAEAPHLDEWLARGH